MCDVNQCPKYSSKALPDIQILINTAILCSLSNKEVHRGTMISKMHQLTTTYQQSSLADMSSVIWDLIGCYNFLNSASVSKIFTVLGPFHTGVQSKSICQIFRWIQTESCITMGGGVIG